VTASDPSLAHLERMTDDTGIFEHAIGPVPRRANGWCTDDNGRALAAVCRAQDDPAVPSLATRYLAFLEHAHQQDGRFHLRLAYDRRWREDPSSDDANGRALFGLAVAAARGPEPLRWVAADLFTRASAQRSDHPRATAHAAVAAAEFLAADPASREARALLGDAARTLAPFLAPFLAPDRVERAGWLWPSPRLTYANALIPEALVAIGAALGDPEILARGLRLLSWLADEETVAGSFSFAPTGGRGPGEARPAYDQQPIEAASFADAFARAFDVTGDPSWLAGLARAVAWIHGDNDSGAPLLDSATGGGFDGLTPGGVNRNEGAESTIAVITTLQHAHRLLPVARRPALDEEAHRAALRAVSN
jgi:hypothetical protein